MNLKKYFSYILLFVSFSTLAGDFRSSNWGDSISKTKTLETAELLDQVADFLTYKTSLASIEMLVLFNFFEDALYRGAYFSGESYSNKNSYIDDYDKIKELLIKKYGAPLSDDVVWLNPNSYYRDDKNEWGMAISRGDLAMRTIWKTDTTRIMHGVKGDNFIIDHGIFYEELASQEKMQKIDEDKDLDAL